MNRPPLAPEIGDGLVRAGLRWHPGTGQSSLSGPLLRLAGDCDAAFTSIAAVFGAAEERHPAFVPATTLHRLGYFTAFPHQMTLAVCLAADEHNLESFADGSALEGDAVRPSRLAPIREVLTPAACYHVYAAHEGETLPAPLYLTTVNTCFRRESFYEPLTRQWGFTMREIVCAGTLSEVRAFLARARDLAGELCAALDLPITWETATDPFFRPYTDPRALLQRVAPTKEEATFGERLAIASVNLHHDHLGTAFGLTREGAPAYTGCLAFGIERWLHALTQRHGSDPAGWPSVTAAARRVGP